MHYTSSISMCVLLLLTACPQCLKSGCRNTWVRQAHNGKPTFHRLLLVRHISDSKFSPRGCFPMHKQAACLSAREVVASLLSIAG